MKLQPVPAQSDKACSCCHRMHRKLYPVDGYWLGIQCAKQYALYKINPKVESIYWFGHQQQHDQIARMVHDLP